MRLHQGDYDDVVASADDPAGSRRGAGATRARGASTSSTSTAPARAGARPELVRAASRRRAPRSRCRPRAGSDRSEDARALLDAGADRVVVGTAAWPDPAPWVEALGAVARGRARRPGRPRAHGGLDARRGLSAADALGRAAACGVLRCLVTAIERDGTLAGPDLELVRAAAAAGPAVLAAGGIRSPEDVAALAAAGAEAAIVGRALLTAPTP